jgi:NAD(P)-dependent dehydrogenase (short-subunit alcohol dehydrogenase family)
MLLARDILFVLNCCSTGDTMGRLEGKIAIVIGAGQSPGESIGNGRATTIRFIQEGASVLAVDRDFESARETLRMAGSDDFGEAFEADVTRTDSLKAAVDAAMSRWGRVDILHYNVGVSVMAGRQELDLITDEVFDRVHAINLRGAVMAAKFVEPIMRRQQSGCIVNVSSITAVETLTPLVAYRTSKAGLVAFTQQFAMHNAAYGIRANVILPGLMETAMAVETRMRLSGRTREDIVAERNAKVPLRKRGGTGWDVANAALFLASDEADFITGVSLPVDGGTLMKIGW